MSWLPLHYLTLLIILLTAGCFQPETPTGISTGISGLTNTPYAGNTGATHPSANALIPTTTESLVEISTLPLVMADTPAAKTNTPQPVITDTPTLVTVNPTQPPVATTPGAVTLHLMADVDTLTLYVAAQNNLFLGGLELRVKNNDNNIQVVNIPERFDILELTNFYAQPGSCFVLRQAGTDSPLPDTCTQSNQVFRYDVARADVFWYDTLHNIPRDIVVMNNDELVTICPAALPNCPIQWYISSPVQQ